MDTNNKTDSQNQETSNPSLTEAMKDVVVNIQENQKEQLKTESPTDPNPVNMPVLTSEQFDKRKKNPKKMILFACLFLILFSFGLMFFKNIFTKTTSHQSGSRGDIIWWGINEYQESLISLIDEFQDKNPGTKITYIRQSPKDYSSRLINSLQSGKGPDIFEIPTAWIPAYKNLLGTIPKDVFSEEEYEKTFLRPVSDALTTNNGIVGIPLYYDALTLFINEKIFTSSLKNPPLTWDELSNLSGPDVNGLTLISNGGIVRSAIAMGNTKNVNNWQEIIALLLLQNQVNLSKPLGVRTNDAIKYYTNFSSVWNENLPQSKTAFSQEILAMYFGKTLEAGSILRENPNLKFKTVKVPQLPKNSVDDPSFTYSSFWFHGVYSRSINSQSAWKLLKFLSENESINQINSQRKKYNSFELLPPRQDMIEKYFKDPILGSLVSDMNYATHWYLVGGVEDKNSEMSNTIDNIFSSAVKKNEFDTNLDTEFKKILATYQIPSN